MHLPTKTLGRVSVLLLAGLSAARGQKEQKLGAALADDVVRRNTPIESAYVQRLAEALTTQRYHITLIAEKPGHRELLYFPGGFIIVPANLMLRAQTEKEFATMLAHAMAHIDRRHGWLPNSRIPTFVSGTEEYPLPLCLEEVHLANEIEANQQAAVMTSGWTESPNGEFRRFQEEIRSLLSKRPHPSLRGARPAR